MIDGMRLALYGRVLVHMSAFVMANHSSKITTHQIVLRIVRMSRMSAKSIVYLVCHCSIDTFPVLAWTVVRCRSYETLFVQ